MLTIVGSKMTAAALVACVTVIVPRGSISALLAHPESYDGQSVAIAGRVQKVELNTSPGGSDYEVFQLCDKACVSVFTRGHPLLSEGQRKSLRGTFVSVKHVGANTVHNEVEADRDSL
jgi:hypothetical protein